MDRLTTNKPVGEMTMTEVAHNCCYADEDGWARYRDYETDIDARQLARDLLKRYVPELDVPKEDEDLEQFLWEELSSGLMDGVVALVAFIYYTIWSKADLREHLSAYESTGANPEDVQKYLEYEFDPESTARIVQTIIRYPLCLKNVADLVESIPPLLHRMDGYDAIKRIANWTQAESEGRLIVLPCKVGDTVYAVEPDLCDLRDKDTCGAYCDGWDFSCPDFHSGSTIRQRHFQVEDLRHFGKTVFPSHEEAARAALGGGKP